MTKTIFLVGDWGFDSNKCKNAFQNIHHDEIILLGDNFYPSGVLHKTDIQWEKKLKNFFPPTSKKYAVLGNHDYLENVFAQISYTFYPNNHQWYMPTFFYDEIDLDYDCHHIFIDTCIFDPNITTMYSRACNISSQNLQQYFGIVFHYQEKQKKWLQKVLEESTCKWKMVYGHYPVISNGPHQQATEFASFVKPLFERTKVDIYASGHDHNCQVLYDNGVTYLVSGGSNQYEPTSPSSKNVFTSDKEGFLFLSLRKNAVDIQYCSLDQEKYLVFCHSKSFQQKKLNS